MCFVIRFSGTNLEYLIEILISNSVKFKLIPVKQCLPLLVIPIIWNHLAYSRKPGSQLMKYAPNLKFFALAILILICLLVRNWVVCSISYSYKSLATSVLRNG